MQLLEDETIQSLEQEFEAMLQQEAENMKGAWDIRAQKKKEEEEQRKEEMRIAMESKNSAQYFPSLKTCSVLLLLQK